ncbi:hypothetical protein DER44DRAFT_483883 [Fusarium oxysporum]|nr:hypothetical protein DER44DRAFT_483883 [Fusarium oxysporum]
MMAVVAWAVLLVFQAPENGTDELISPTVPVVRSRVSACNGLGGWLMPLCSIHIPRLTCCRLSTLNADDVASSLNLRATVTTHSIMQAIYWIE